VGSDGVLWNLSAGPVKLGTGVSGLVPADVEHYWSESPLMPGAVHRGYRPPAQMVRLPVRLRADGLALRDLDGELWRSLDPGGECVLRVTSPDAVTRTLPMRFVGVGDVEFNRDPIVMGQLDYTLTFTAPDPLWRGETETATVTPPDAGGFPTAFAHRGGVINLVTGLSSGSSVIRNNGDAPSWPVYAVSGPVDAFKVGVGDSTLNYGAVEEGATVWVDTHPLRQTIGFARDANDEGAWSQVTRRAFDAVPAGVEVPVTLEMTFPGPGASATVEVTPRSRRPW